MSVASSLRVAIVSFAPDIAVLKDTVQSLVAALDETLAVGLLQRAELVVVDNGPGAAWTARLNDLTQIAGRGRDLLDTCVLSGHDNVGYGRGNNLALLGSDDEFLLVLNPDVVLERSALVEALKFMRGHPEVGLMAPRVTGRDGERQFLCKRLPSVFDLALRGFAPEWLRRLFAERLAAYEMQDLPDDRPSFGIPIVSGCFMLFRGDVFRRLRGFDADFFMYFEDFDLSLRAGKLTGVAYVPAVRVTHYGGGASRKGWRHIRMFVASALTFFRKHGWRWA